MKTLNDSMLIPCLALSCFAAAVSTASGQAQSQPELDETQVATAIGQAFGISETHGELIAMAPSYEAIFDANGMRFDPVVGQAGPLRSLRLDSRTVSRGGAFAREFTRGTARRVDDRIEIVRGFGITERYDVGEEGVELSYEFKRPLGSNGDLVVRTQITSQMTAPIGTFTTGIEFAGKEGYGVSIGAVTGIDAIGETVQGSLRWDGAHLDLVLPAAFAAHATYPVVLDPLIGSSFVGDPGTFDSLQVDVAYEPSSARYLAVFVRDIATDAARIRGQRFTVSGNPVDPVFSISGGGPQRSQHPAVANNNAFNRFGVAWQQADSVLGQSDIMFAAVEASNGSVGAIVPVANTAADEVWPDVSGERSTTVSSARDEVIVVWENDSSGIWASEVDLDPIDASPGTPVQIYSSSTAGKPAISKSGGDLGRHLITWEHAANDIRAKLVSRELSDLTSPLLINGNGFNPDVDGDGDTFLIAFDRHESGGLSGPRDIFCQMVVRNGANLELRGTADAVASRSNEDETEPAVGFFGPKFAVAWSEQDSGVFDYRGRVRAFAPDRCVVCGPLQSFGTGAFRVAGIEIGARWAGGSSSDQGLLAWGQFDVASPFTSEVHLQRFEAMTGAGSVVSNVAAGCGGGGVASISGTFQFANSVGINLNGADPLALNGVLHIGTSTAPVVPCGPCSILTPFVAVPVNIALGDTSIGLNIGCSSDLVGQTLRFQFANTITSTAPCLNLPVGLSNILEATLVY